MNEKLWECPRCGGQFITPGNIYHAICACLTYNAPLPLLGSTPVVTEQMLMIDITHRQRRQVIAVPVDLRDLL